MEITEVKIFLKEGQDKKLKAYATLTFDNIFVVRNVKVIEGTKGLFVAMPSRKLKDPCPKCNFRNVVRSKYCNNCGSALPMTEHRAPAAGAEGGPKESEHKDIAHPITAECRDYIQKKVLDAYDKEKRSPSTAHAPASAAPAAAPSAAPSAQSRVTSKPAPAMDEENDIEL
jgi:stage V sporulation protein G